MATYGEVPEKVTFIGKDIFEVTSLVERLAQLQGHETEYLIEKVQEGETECSLEN